MKKPTSEFFIMPIISLAIQKDGPGKTTTAINLAAVHEAGLDIFRFDKNTHVAEGYYKLSEGFS